MAFKIQSIVLVLFFINCAGASVRETTSVDTLRTIVDSEPAIPERTRVLLRSEIQSLSFRLQENERQYKEQMEEFAELKSKYDSLYRQYSESQRDAGFKDTVKFQTYAIAGLIVSMLIGAILYLFMKKGTLSIGGFSL